MDEEMEDFVADYLEFSGVDYDYEFDAGRFFDFTRPESSFETEEAERWFESAGNYPPSPFIMRLKWREDNTVENANASLESTVSESMISSSFNLDCSMDFEVSVLDDNKKGPKTRNDIAQDIIRTKTKPVAKSSVRSSTLMEPTASHLAKLSQAREIHSSRYLGRFQKPLNKVDERSMRNPPGVDSDATKRQKLENGYLRKVAHLKHQSLLLHKLPKVRQVDANTVTSRLKVTIPREPDLETAHRAQRHRSRNNSEPGEHAKSKGPTFKARPLNRKIFKAPSLPPHRKSRPQSPAFQEFHFKTSERAMQHSSSNNFESFSKNGSADVEMLNDEDARKQEKCETLRTVKPSPLCKKIGISKHDVVNFRNVKEETRIPVERKLPTVNRLSYNPPIELFNKLSLKSNLDYNARSPTEVPLHAEGPKENVPGSIKQEHRGYGRKQDQCGSQCRIPEIKPCLNINRSMDIR